MTNPITNQRTSISSSSHFADRLCAAVIARQTPLVVGIDPRLKQLPAELLDSVAGDFSLEKQAALFQYYSCEVIDAVADLVPAIKPQSAFFEQLGPQGMLALAAVVDHAKAAGLLVIMDAKRGDIGSTAEAYADAYLGEKPASPWGCDALTINPYLGNDTLEPFFQIAQQRASGLFVLVKTSNPGSDTLQEQIVQGQPLYAIVANHLQNVSRETAGASGYGIAGAVVGATYPQQLAELRARMPNVLLLVPGFGAQGGTAADVAGGLDENGLGAVINSSRGIIFAYQNDQYAGRGSWQDAVAAAAHDAISQLADETPAGKLRVARI